MQHDTTPPRRLSDILNGGADSLRSAWADTKPAEEFKPLPKGTYTARVVTGELFTAKSGTAGYKLTFRVLDGDHVGRHFWHDLWLTPAALPMTKRDLGKLGVTSVDQLDAPIPPGIRCSVQLALRRNDDGTEFNRVRTFGVVGIDSVDDDDFGPVDTPAAAAPTVEGKAL